MDALFSPWIRVTIAICPWIKLAVYLLSVSVWKVGCEGGVHAWLVISVTMPKRKLEDELEEDWAEAGTKSKPGNKKNSLDSDEEDDGEEKTYDILAEDEIEGEVFGLTKQSNLFLLCSG
jgi:hypothetical protein